MHHKHQASKHLLCLRARGDAAASPLPTAAAGEGTPLEEAVVPPPMAEEELAPPLAKEETTEEAEAREDDAQAPPATAAVTRTLRDPKVGGSKPTHFR